MEFVKKAEDKLAGIFKGAPKLQGNTKESLVKIWPWLALVGAILQALAVLTIWRWAHNINDYYRDIGVNVVGNRLTFWIWVSIVVLAAEAVLLFMAFPKLRRREKSGWDLLFLVGLINVLYAVVSLFSDYGSGIFSLVWNVFVAAVLFWLLFAVREKYKK